MGGAASVVVDLVPIESSDLQISASPNVEEAFSIILRNNLFHRFCGGGKLQSMVMMPKILIAGAGVTGALCAHILKRDLQHKIELVIWEKARGPGGRMSTSRKSDNSQCSVDLGAQYITVTPQYAESHKRYHEELISNGVLVPFEGRIEGSKESEPGTLNFVTPNGSSSIVKHFLQTSGATVDYQHHLSKLEAANVHESTQPEIPSVKMFLDTLSDDTAVKPATTEKGTRIKIVANPQEERAAGSQHDEVFDAVILTMPTGQVLQQKGLVQEALAKNALMKSHLQSVRYSSRYALGLFYKPGTALDLPWCARYVQGDPCIRWISADVKKRGADAGSLGPSLVVHTSVPFGIQHLEADKDEIQRVIMQHLYQLLPDLPEPAEVKCLRWRYSQVTTPYEGNPGCIFLARLPTYAVVAAGDAFTHSNLDGCISSAETTCERLVEYFTETNQLKRECDKLEMEHGAEA
ncbi:renalase-like [Acanthaster planci]|uniref:Renalase-like n=1 Tax=Acanthaster planci TaxID=133434 RepID=A0A8B8A5A6_ACAPL|nr:renalase-like [Acanthaster planci]